MNLLELLQDWMVGNEIKTQNLLGIKIIWWGRCGKLMQFLGGLTVVLDLIGEARLTIGANSMQRRFSTLVHNVRKLPSQLLDFYKDAISRHKVIAIVAWVPLNLLAVYLLAERVMRYGPIYSGVFAVVVSISAPAVILAPWGARLAAAIPILIASFIGNTIYRSKDYAELYRVNRRGETPSDWGDFWINWFVLHPLYLPLLSVLICILLAFAIYYPAMTGIFGVWALARLVWVGISAASTKFAAWVLMVTPRRSIRWIAVATIATGFFLDLLAS